QSLRYLLPFVPIMKGGEEEVTVRKALQLLREDGELLEFENLLAFFATFVLNTKIVQQIMRWDMAVLEQSPWYQQILQEGMQRGILSGIELGLELKFGSSGKEIFSEINTIENIQVLETILASIKTVETIEELRQVYQSHS
ncbi:MAG: transposase, partial [Trichodesmium sp.]